MSGKWPGIRSENSLAGPPQNAGTDDLMSVKTLTSLAGAVENLVLRLEAAAEAAKEAEAEVEALGKVQESVVPVVW